MNVDIEKLLDSADLMVSLQNYQKAIAIYGQIIEENKEHDEAYLLRGELYGKLGQTEKAFIDVLKAISIDPDYDYAHHVLALLYMAQGDLEKSIDANQKAIELNRNNKEAIHHIIQAYEVLADKQLVEHQPEAAVNNYNLALNHAPENINLLCKLAFAMSRNGDFEKAIRIVDQIFEKDSKHVPARSLLVSIYEKTGCIENGWDIINSLIQDHPNNPLINITYGKYALRKKHQTIAIDKLTKVLKLQGLGMEDKISMHMLMGKLYDSISEYDKAFKCFSSANNLKYNEYDVAEFEELITSIIDYFSKDKFNKLPSSHNYSIECIYILGMPRSGTSLIEQIISSHSRVYGGGELQYIPGFIKSMHTTGSGKQYPGVLDQIGSDSLDRYADKLLKMMRDLSPEAEYITDKLPHNFLLIGFIHKLLPNARIINCLRNPVDNCLSCYFQHFGGYHPYAYDLSHLGRYYHQYRRLMDHWEHVLEIPIYNVHYENIVNNTKYEIEKLLSYLKLDWEDSCLRFYHQNRTINTASYTQVSRKIYKDSTNRWINYEPYITELIDALGIHSKEASIR